MGVALIQRVPEPIFLHGRPGAFATTDSKLPLLARLDGSGVGMTAVNRHETPAAIGSTSQVVARRTGAWLNGT